jgi:hypothetical protein
MKAKTKPLLLRGITNVLEFGKHKGKTIQQVILISGPSVTNVSKDANKGRI